MTHRTLNSNILDDIDQHLAYEADMSNRMHMQMLSKMERVRDEFLRAKTTFDRLFLAAHYYGSVGRFPSDLC